MGDVMLKDILMSVSKKMQIDFEGITSKIQHNGEKGTARENICLLYTSPDRFPKPSKIFMALKPRRVLFPM